jgi:hypothetical protein
MLMRILNRLIVFFIGMSFPTISVVLVWLFTFMSFNLLEVLHHSIFRAITVLVLIVWGIMCLCIEEKGFPKMVD